MVVTIMPDEWKEGFIDFITSVNLNNPDRPDWTLQFMTLEYDMFLPGHWIDTYRIEVPCTDTLYEWRWVLRIVIAGGLDYPVILTAHA